MRHSEEFSAPLAVPSVVSTRVVSPARGTRTSSRPGSADEVATTFVKIESPLPSSTLSTATL
ncbi:hypothetical protein FQZ97_416540 [compost metagenome]